VQIIIDMFRLMKNSVMPCAVVLAFILTIEICARIDDAIRFRAPFWETYTADRLRTIDKDGR
jgi:hypothetical protein